MWEILGYLVFIGGLLIWGAAAVFGMVAVAEYAPTFGKVILIILGIIAVIGTIAECRLFKKD